MYAGGMRTRRQAHTVEAERESLSMEGEEEASSFYSLLISEEPFGATKPAEAGTN